MGKVSTQQTLFNLCIHKLVKSKARSQIWKKYLQIKSSLELWKFKNLFLNIFSFKSNFYFDEKLCMTNMDFHIWNRPGTNLQCTCHTEKRKAEKGRRLHSHSWLGELIQRDSSQVLVSKNWSILSWAKPSVHSDWQW